MKTELEFERVDHLNEAARDELKRRVEAYAQDLLQEAERLEAGQRSSSGTPELTSSMVSDADLLLRKGYSRPKRPIGVVIAQVLSYTCALGAGIATNALGTLLGQVAFAVIVVIGVISATISVVKGPS